MKLVVRNLNNCVLHIPKSRKSFLKCLLSSPIFHGAVAKILQGVSEFSTSQSPTHRAAQLGPLQPFSLILAESVLGTDRGHRCLLLTAVRSSQIPQILVGARSRSCSMHVRRAALKYGTTDCSCLAYVWFITPVPL